MKYAVVGSGAIGAYYGAKLAKAGKDVHFLFHNDYEYVKLHGLKINSCDGDFSINNVNAYNSTFLMPKCDVILVCLKSTNQHLLKELLPPLLHYKSLIVLIQNGIGLESDLQILFPKIAIAAGLAFICSSKTKPGVVDHQCYGSINVGNYSCKDNNTIISFLNDLLDSKIEVNEVDYNEARWKKAVWNMPFNGMTVALSTTTDKLLSFPETEQLIYSQMFEVIAAANSLGVKNIDKSFADKMISMTKSMTPYSPSMKLDYDFKRPMEIYYLYQRPIEEALKVGCKMPKLEMLYAQLKFLQSLY